MIFPPISSPDQINSHQASSPTEPSTPIPNPIVTRAFQELSEPLTALRMGVAYIQDYLPASHREGLILFRANVLELERLTTNLHYLTTPPPFASIPGRLAVLLPRVVSTWEELFTARRIGLQFQTTADLPPISFDADRLGCILNNLLAFCFKALATGDRLHLTLTSDYQSQIINFICDCLPTGTCDLAGPLATAVAGDKSWLPLTRQLIEQHQGQFHLQADTRCGQKFSIYLPSGHHPIKS